MVLQVRQRGAELVLTAASLLLREQLGEEFRPVAEFLRSDPRPVTGMRIELLQAAATLLQALAGAVEDLGREGSAVLGGGLLDRKSVV